MKQRFYFRGWFPQQ